MNKTKYTLLIGVLLCVPVFYGCGHRQGKMTHTGADSTYTVSYIRSISFSEPEKALECFREVYQVRPKYRDVAARVEGAQKPAESAAEPAPEQSAPEK